MRLSGEGKNEPEINKLDLTAIEYREFLSTFQFTNKWLMQWMQNHIKDGVRIPFKPDEFLIDVKFQEGSMHVMLDVEDGIAEVLEDRFWWDQ